MNPAIRLIRPALSFEDVRADFQEVFDTGVFTRGRHTLAFARQIEAYTGARYAFLTTSATTALWTCLRLLDIGVGDEVAVADFSFPATANVVEDVGARPVFVDVRDDTYNMSASHLREVLSPRVKAVIFVDALGNPDGLLEIRELCASHGVPLIEDAACAMGSSARGIRCGSIADLTCFSFHPRKLICAGEGGAITTNRSDWAEWLEVKLAHGASGGNGIALDFPTYGYNFRLTELQAIMGRVQLARLDAVVAARRQIQREYAGHLAPLGFVAQSCADDVEHNMQSVVFRVPVGVDRDRLVLGLRHRGVEATLGTYAMSELAYYKDQARLALPVSTRLQKSTITLPCFEGIDVGRVVGAIREVLHA